MLTTTPTVSVITTVYDRVDCLRRCLRAMQHSRYTDYEQIVVADAPPPEVEQEIAALTKAAGPQVRYILTAKRHNDWGMTPAWIALGRARGQYASFLSDDNAYLPDHLTPLVNILDRQRQIGFAYSSCQYDNRLVLSACPPAPARIDLGQPLFRRQVLLDTFPNGLPFKQFAWDWLMIDALMKAGVRWKHHPVPSFVFRLASYPKIMEALA